MTSREGKVEGSRTFLVIGIIAFSRAFSSSKTQLAGSGVGAPMRMFHPCLHKPLRLRVEATRGLTAEDALCPKSLSQPHPPAPSGLREHSLDLAGGQSKIQPRFPPRITRLLFDLRVKK
ncbi:hypothetical protein V6N11_026041 [Hibiscus sabdariffa]|uniref:Uncharacterized protein n=1 Tax=Hibiscus sabdariffa TaxID=183260 RepID=A0ABR2SUH5_9ROSI